MSKFGTRNKDPVTACILAHGRQMVGLVVSEGMVF